MKPVLFLIFNRPEATRQTFAEIRKYQPRQLFVAADGPRRSTQNEPQLCEQTRRLITDNVDWDCKVSTLFRDENLGCEQAVSSGITWFFQNVEEGLILEDDCLPDPSFFVFCEAMLNKYRDDKRIGTISGDNFQRGNQRGSSSYFFSKYFHCWGWATWRDRWQLYQNSLYENSSEIANVIQNYPTVFGEQKYWESVFIRTHERKIDTWDYRFQYALWKTKVLSILPQVNLVENIGFTEEATHTASRKPVFADRRHALPMPLVHPARIEQNVAADFFAARKNLGINMGLAVRNVVRRCLNWVGLAAQMPAKHRSACRLPNDRNQSRTL